MAYTVKRYARDAKTSLAPPELRAIHPLGMSPVITEGDHTVAESGAIAEYLIERHGQGQLIPPPGSSERLRYTYWLHYAEGSAMLPLLLKLIFGRIKTTPAPFFARPIIKGLVAKVNAGFIDPQLKLHLDYMNAELARSTWFAGAEFTAADIQMSFPLEAAANRSGLTDYPKLSEFLSRIHARPAYQQALEKGGPYELLR